MSLERDFERVVVISDLHSGHKVGLTPPKLDYEPDFSSEEYPFFQKRRGLWKLYADTIESLKPIDYIIANGDLIDGKGPRSGGTELLTTDRSAQTDMAAECIRYANAKKVLLSYGTSYHTGVEEDWEQEVALKCGGQIEGYGRLNIRGLQLDYRHHIGTSQASPYTRFTAIARERMWSILWNEHGDFPRADVIIRSHAHYHVFCGGPGWLAMITPALQGYWTKYGSRRMSGTVDMGLVKLDVYSKERMEWEAITWHLKDLEEAFESESYPPKTG